MNMEPKPKLQVLSAQTRRRSRSGRGWLRRVEVIVAEITPEHLGYVTSEVLRLTIAHDHVRLEEIEIVVRF